MAGKYSLMIDYSTDGTSIHNTSMPENCRTPQDSIERPQDT